jgi:hypothetical protein
MIEVLSLTNTLPIDGDDGPLNVLSQHFVDPTPHNISKVWYYSICSMVE